MKKVITAIMSLFSVYNRWTGEKRMSREMWKAAIVSTVSLAVIIAGFFYDVTEVQATAFITWAMATVDMYLRITSKGGEAVIKPDIQAQIDKADAVAESLMPDPINDNLL